MVRVHSYAALVSDVHMPGLGGVLFVRALRTWSARLPIILMSGEGLPREFDGARLEPLHFLAKPFTAEALVAAVRTAIDASARRGAH